MVARAHESRRLVIDTDVASAASDRPSLDQRPRLCGEFLLTARALCHRLVFPDPLRRQWRNHRSGFTSRWLADMYRRGKHKVITPEPPNPSHLAGLENRIRRMPEASQELVRGDLLLMEAALGADEVIISLDNTARDLFARIALDFRPLQRILWVSPVACDWHGWLRDGAPFREDFCLEHYGRGH